MLALGPRDATLSAVAARLGVHHTTLYGHVRDRADALTAAADLLVAELDRPDPDRPWPALLTAWGEAFWTLCERRPGAARLILGLPAPPAEAVRRFGEVVAALRGQGFTEHDATVAADLVAELALGTAATVADLDRDAQRTAWERPADPAGEATPHPAPVMDALIGHPRGAYPDKLRIVLAGLATLLDPGDTHADRTEAPDPSAAGPSAPSRVPRRTPDRRAAARTDVGPP